MPGALLARRLRAGTIGGPVARWLAARFVARPLPAVVADLVARLAVDGDDFHPVVLASSALHRRQEARGDRAGDFEQGFVGGDADRTDIPPADMAATAQQRKRRPQATCLRAASAG